LIIAREHSLHPVGNVPSGSTPRVIREGTELEDVRIGEVIAPLNDYCLLWDEVSVCLPDCEEVV
jgi:hypothetical protein